jgi:hypothetical protein
MTAAELAIAPAGTTNESAMALMAAVVSMRFIESVPPEGARECLPTL